TGRYRQLTAEDGHVLAMARAPGGNRIAVITAEKLVRGAAGDQALRGTAVRELALATMAAGPPALLEGDVRRGEIGSASGGFVFRLAGTKVSGAYRLTPNGTLEPAPDIARADRPLALLTGEGAAPRRTQRFGSKDCPFTAREERGEGGVPVITVADHGGKP